MGLIKRYQMERAEIEHISEAESDLLCQLQYGFENVDLFKEALTHKSATDPSWIDGKNNERLEFLGDSILGVCVSEILYNKYPEATEGQMSKVRAELVCTKTLAMLARHDYKLGDVIILGRGEGLNGGSDKDKILAGTMEALIGAIYVDSQFYNVDLTSKVLSIVRGVVENMYPAYAFLPEQIEDFDLTDYKSQLQEYIQKEFKSAVIYETMGFTGFDHDRTWEVSASYITTEEEQEHLAYGEGKSVREAQKLAAMRSLDYYGQLKEN